MQALAKDLPWKLKESRVLEILQAVSIFPEKETSSWSVDYSFHPFSIFAH